MKSKFINFFLPAKIKNRVGLLIGVLGFGTVIINLGILFMYLNGFIKDNIMQVIDSHYKTNESRLIESILYDDIFTLFITLKQISSNTKYIKNIYLFDKNKNYLADAKAQRDMDKLDYFADNDFVKLKAMKIKNDPIGYILFIIDKDSINEYVKINLFKLGFVNILIILFGVLLGLYLTKLLIRPMNDFVEQINNLNYDNLPFKTYVHDYASIEIKKLSKTLNEMSERLYDTLNKFYEEERKARRSEKLASIGMMAAGLAHELKNPIMTINLMVYQLSKCSPGSSGCSEDLNVIKKEANRLVSRINEFLEYTKPVKIEKSVTNVVDIKKELFSYFDRLDINVKFNFSSEIDKFFVDKEKLIQVLLNLINNSIDANANKIDVKLYKNDQNVIIEVIDDGYGIKEKDKDKIFMPFFTTKSKGTGLGLAICDMIITAMDGELILINSNANETIFMINLRSAYVN
ncbi:ATP-binding protein [Deferribacter thermophilus]|uniref:two-component system sensor histidine kinase NtrB n=1 Tax=Deferribacter thermophilus TaxID=53573 RepID=UPI003C16B646